MGIPGAGKTTLASKVIDDLLPLEDDTTCVLFVYCRYTEDLSVTDILKALVKQCLERHPNVFPAVESLYRRHKLEKTEPSLEELVDLLKSLEGFFIRIFYVIDGVDEAPVDVRFDLIKVLNKLHGNIFLTSRPLDHLGKKLEFAVLFSVVAQEDDVVLLIEEKLERNEGLSNLLDRHNMKGELVRKIIDKAEGMILHAVLQVDALQECATVTTLRQRLEEFPSGIQGMYATTVARIERQTPEFCDIAMRALLWVVFADASLSMEDLQRALAVHPETSKFDDERMPDSSTILSVCCGLIEIQEETKVVRLVHFTAKDALKPILLERFPQPKLVMFKVLIERVKASKGLRKPDTIILSTEAELPPSAEDPLLFHALFFWPVYANWFIHDPSVVEAILSLLLEAKAFGVIPAPNDFRYNKPGAELYQFMDFVGPLHVVIQYTLPISIFDAVISRTNCSINEQSPRFQLTPLLIAVVFGKLQYVEHLLDMYSESVDVNASDCEGKTPLGITLLRPPEAGIPIAKRLLEHPDINANIPDNTGVTPFIRASALAIEPIVELMVDRDDVDVAAVDNNGAGALLFVVTMTIAGKDTMTPEMKRVIKRLIQCPRVPTVSILFGVARRPVLHTTIFSVSPKLSLDLVEMFILHRPDELNITDHVGRTPLACAAIVGDKDIVRMLLATNKVDVCAQDLQGYSAAVLAAKSAHNQVRRHLNDPDLPRPEEHILLEILLPSRRAKRRLSAPLPNAEERALLQQRHRLEFALEVLLKMDVGQVWIAPPPEAPLIQERGMMEFEEVVWMLLSHSDVDLNARDEDCADVGLDSWMQRGCRTVASVRRDRCWTCGPRGVKRHGPRE
ncbi:ankyrin repeat domain-containing protein 50 [Coprinopsis cinerea AmutBmut pab1-1]|nr:ankyrin repeat domain-containing protein 50 [Coprinopsis cinerea AmutBmut pab1-1]